MGNVFNSLKKGPPYLRKGLVPVFAFCVRDWETTFSYTGAAFQKILSSSLCGMVLLVLIQCIFAGGQLTFMSKDVL